ncbi:voltage-dependent anion channel-domain-containing protein [Irpex rosettiformis]|uniref:Voltage-dependent anion channel-domain-containing protein n=1 Tax=Irpex rosettiformis TaxID=378272 RepID=A0ACB8U200_9APHY|nr:voltage-dependent anion channel-domain-containing protein [Irpex rosettiformis]
MSRAPSVSPKCNANKKSLKDCVRHFTPAWFAVIMGTGIVSILWHNYPYDGPSKTFTVFTYTFFFLNLTLFLIFNVLTVARYIIFPDIWSLMIRHPVQSLYLGCYPMGLTTLINIAVILVYQQDRIGGKRFLHFVWGIWWIDIVLSFCCVFGLVHWMKTRQDHALSKMTAIWLLPVVTFIVASSTGGILAPALLEHSRYHALITLTVSAFMVFVGLSLAFMIFSAYILRLITCGVPPGASVISTFIPLGPMGQGGYSMLLLGQGFRAVLPLSNSSQVLSDPRTGETLNVICVAAGFVLWAIATMWFLYALLAVSELLNPWSEAEKFPFKLPVWGLIFPNGVYANLTLQLAKELDIKSLRVYGAIHAAATLILWSLVFTRTLTLLHHGRIFDSPCIEEIDMGRKNRKDLNEELTYRHHEQQEEEAMVELQQGLADGDLIGEVWRDGDSRAVTIRPMDM